MAQLVKLKDYISRYEWNVYRYPSQYIRLKQDNWKKMKHSWDAAASNQKEPDSAAPSASRLSKWLPFMKKNTDQKAEEIKSEQDIPNTEQELKQLFLDQLLPFQFKWATSTVTDVSFVDPVIYDDQVLTYFLQRFPDTYLLMYYPIFHIKQAPMEGDIILVSPLEIEIIHFIKGQSGDVIRAQEGRTWTVEHNGQERTMLNPEIALKRSESIVKRLLAESDIQMTVKRTVLTHDATILTSHQLYQTRVVDAHSHNDWLQEKRTHNSPLKNVQLKATGVLLKHCLTSAVKRPEWEKDGTEFSMKYEEH
ncbi:RNA 2',3'-cyclic phosphodiesterase [Lentibacillus sp. JNUCC-1]|uniref:NERD domain-containing protein n=1 Tax=Lentibacillus sp. JNUCC-1 TaxID=2654513 RepID=UPI0012E73084|nr:NERD domain-containing protein [Lentibacillus sp. JNUCC-1]MUV39270.1 RNA 2',3'-cyclic phosphodiesterase [Lentibacillus sp. JNUCC-1]